MGRARSQASGWRSSATRGARATPQAKTRLKEREYDSRGEEMQPGTGGLCANGVEHAVWDKRLPAGGILESP